MEIITKCCNKEMVDLGEVSFMDMNTNSCKRFVCSVCGKYIDIHAYTLDSEEMVNDLGNYVEEHPELKQLIEGEKA